MSGDALSAQLEELMHRYGLTNAGARPSLDQHARSLIALAACAMTGTDEELADRITDATVNGVTKPEISEVFLQLAVLAGLPVAQRGFTVAQQTFAEQDQAKDHDRAADTPEGTE